MRPSVGCLTWRRKWWTLIAVCTATFMLLLDITIVNVALPAIQRALDASFSDLQWVVDAYALALATCVLTAGALADLFGRKRRLPARHRALHRSPRPRAALANDPLFLIIARGVQGIGGAMMFATALALLSQEFHGTRARHGVRPLGRDDRRRRRDRAARGRDAHLLALVALDLPRQHPDRRRARSSCRRRQLHESSDPEHSRLDPIGLVTLHGRALLPDPRADRGQRARLDERAASSALLVAAVVAARPSSSRRRRATARR